MTERLSDINKEPIPIINHEKTKLIDNKEAYDSINNYNLKEKLIDDSEKETIRLEALKKAEEIQNVAETKKTEDDGKVKGFISRKQKETSYKKTIIDIQTDMKPADRLFSKVIHNPIIEKSSEIVARTLARPKPLLYGSIFAFIITLGSYLIAKKMGYKLSGSETILSFSIGYIIGLIYDYIRKSLNLNSSK